MACPLILAKIPAKYALDTHWHEAPEAVRLPVAECIRGQLSSLPTKIFFANAGLTIVDRDDKTMEAVYQLVFQDNQWLSTGIAKRPPADRPRQKSEDLLCS